MKDLDNESLSISEIRNAKKLMKVNKTEKRFNLELCNGNIILRNVCYRIAYTAQQKEKLRTVIVPLD
jgi:hypothetical protein